MEFDVFSINPQDAEFASAPSRNDQPLPRADYRIASVSATFRDITGGQVIDLMFEIADGQYAGRKVQDNFCIKHISAESWYQQIWAKDYQRAARRAQYETWKTAGNSRV